MVEARTDRRQAEPAKPEEGFTRHLILPRALLVGAILWLCSSLAAVAAYAFRYPAFDQFRLYRIYLGMPFPENAIQLENGHRPVLPALVRLAEIRWFAADQWLQIGTGIAFALLALGVIALIVFRDRTLTPLQRSAALLLSVLAIFWLGNARMLMHGNELVHTYLVVLMVVLAGMSIDAARASTAGFRMGVAALCCAVASFSFGTGPASFAALLAAAWVARINLRALIFPMLVLAATLFAYVGALPGNAGIRHNVTLDPIANASVLLRWLASPWMNAWLGMADPPLLPITHAASGGVIGAILSVPARAAAFALGTSWPWRESLVIGAAGVIAWLATVWHARRSSAPVTSLRLLGIVLATFAIGTSAIVCVARLKAFHANPGQVFAERYLPWSCLFWLGIALYAGGSAIERPRRGLVLAVTALACAVIAAPTQRAFAVWSATVFRHVQKSAVAAQLGIWDPEVFPNGPDARRSDVLASLDLLRARHLSMFSEPAFALVESGWRAPFVPAEIPRSGANVNHVFDDTEGRRRVAAIEGFVPCLNTIPRDPTLAVVDGRGTLRGLAKMTRFGPRPSRRCFAQLRRSGFEGYVLDPHPGERLHVLVMDVRDSTGVGSIPLEMPTYLSAGR